MPVFIENWQQFCDNSEGLLISSYNKGNGSHWVALPETMILSSNENLVVSSLCDLPLTHSDSAVNIYLLWNVTKNKFLWKKQNKKNQKSRAQVATLRG